MGRLLRRVVVEGPSMEPTYVAGDRLLVVTRGRKPRPGDVVVIVDPRPGEDREMVKRVLVVHADGSVDVVGDNPNASTDSRTFGPVPANNLRGRVLRQY